MFAESCSLTLLFVALDWLCGFGWGDAQLNAKFRCAAQMFNRLPKWRVRLLFKSLNIGLFSSPLLVSPFGCVVLFFLSSNHCRHRHIVLSNVCHVNKKNRTKLKKKKKKQNSREINKKKNSCWIKTARWSRHQQNYQQRTKLKCLSSQTHLFGSFHPKFNAFRLFYSSHMIHSQLHPVSSSASWFLKLTTTTQPQKNN